MVQFITDKINFFLTPAIVAVGLILNLLTIMVFCRRKMKKYCLSVSMISLAVCDILILAVPVLITWIDDNFFDSYFVNNTIWCNLHGYTDLILSANSSWTIILISVERWFAVWRPWEKSTKFTNRRMRITLLGLFALSLALFSYFPLSLQITQVPGDAAHNSTSLNECNIQMPRLYSLMGIVSVLLVYVVPLVILAFLNVMIIHKLRQRPFRTLTQTSKSRSSSHVANEMALVVNATTTTNNPENHVVSDQLTVPTSELLSEKSKKMSSTNNTSKADQNLSITLVTVAVSFMILILPFQAFWFYETFFKPEGHESTDNEQNLRNMTFIIKNMNYLINFFLYSALSKLFRSEFIALVLDDKFFIIGKCIKCVFFDRNESANRKKKKEQNSHSSFAEVNFSLSTLKKLKSGDFYNAKYIQIQVDPANFVRYFRSGAKAAISNKLKAVDGSSGQLDENNNQEEIRRADNQERINEEEEAPPPHSDVVQGDELEGLTETPVGDKLSKRTNSYPSGPSISKTVVKQYIERRPNA